MAVEKGELQIEKIAENNNSPKIPFLEIGVKNK
jgi:hypothetical protein